MPVGNEMSRQDRIHDQRLVQTQLGAAMRDALKGTLVEPLPFEVRFLLDLLAAKEQAARSSSESSRRA